MRSYITMKVAMQEQRVQPQAWGQATAQLLKQSVQRGVAVLRVVIFPELVHDCLRMLTPSSSVSAMVTDMICYASWGPIFFPGPKDWKFSIPIEIFNLAWKFQSRLKISISTFRIPHINWGLVGGSLEISISLEIFKILNVFNLWAYILRDTPKPWQLKAPGPRPAIEQWKEACKGNGSPRKGNRWPRKGNGNPP